VSNDERDRANGEGDPASPDADGPTDAGGDGPDDDSRRRLLILGGLAALGATGTAGAW
jgi:hypothetical protein